MRRGERILVAALAGLGLVAAAAHAQSKMTIKLSPKYLVTGSTRQIEVVDQNCRVNLGTFSITGGGPAVPVWTNSSLLHDGEEVSP